MTTFDFALIVDRIDLTDEADLDRLFEAGLDDATPSVVNEVQYLDITREARDYGLALLTAIRQVREADGVVRRVFEVDVDREPLPGLVSLADIARRTGWTREYARLLAAGQRGPGSFPTPHRGSSPALYAWDEVIDWLATHVRRSESSRLDMEADQRREVAAVTRAVNLMLEVEQVNRHTWDRIPSRDVSDFVDDLRERAGF